jgi:hypothetical protein
MRILIKIIFLVSVLIVLGCNKDISPSITKGISIGENASSSKDVNLENSDDVKRMALIIGISDYAPATKNDLDGIERDTNKMKKLFENLGFEVTTLYDSQAMKIIDYLDDYAKKLGKDDYFAFYYSGHGSFKTDENGDESDNRDETLVLSDGTINRHLLDDTLYAEFNKIKAKKIIFLDSCHSGTAFRTIGKSRVKAKSISPDEVTDTFPTPNNIRGISIGKSNSKEIIQGNDYIVFSASQDNEESLATPTGSLFTNAIYQTFSDKKYLNKPLKDIKPILTEDIIEYAKKTANPPHHPNITVSDLEIENKSLNSFINEKSTSFNNQADSGTSSISSSLEETLNNMINSGKFKKMSINYQKTSYNTGESVQFTIDTKGYRGFLTIFYIDGNDVMVLYPNGFVSPKRINGQYRFPDDLANGKFELEAYKSCKGCNEEKTVIYTLLSFQQITDIGKIKKGDLMSFPKNSETSQIMSRAVRIKIVPQTKTYFKPQLGKYEFIVK